MLFPSFVTILPVLGALSGTINAYPTESKYEERATTEMSLANLQTRAVGDNFVPAVLTRYSTILTALFFSFHAIRIAHFNEIRLANNINLPTLLNPADDLGVNAVIANIAAQIPQGNAANVDQRTIQVTVNPPSTQGTPGVGTLRLTIIPTNNQNWGALAAAAADRANDGPGTGIQNLRRGIQEAVNRAVLQNARYAAYPIYTDLDTPDIDGQAVGVELAVVFITWN
ncbi:hypothetical protein BGZ60DRAFT_533257 [Tricladium varicosporioides]|nr:hypothetical protein BGZ60DRAFT_533257 [Hymenoscyphus varicosporioides]